MKKIFCLAFAICCLVSAAIAGIPADRIVRPENLPAMGKWMLDRDLNPASWLGVKYKGRSLREPINVVIVDKFSDSDYRARQKLVLNCARAGYKSRIGHSGGYKGYIGGRVFDQIPSESGHAFSNAPFVINNNHGRIFGPYFERGKYYFIASFSRETVAPLSKIKHQYGSFNRARDNFAASMEKRTVYKIIGYANMNNRIVNDGALTTGDHDGSAVILNAVE
ncbi:MAG TPA: hypothetical protein VMD02_06995 [Candidatus Omnitrophota bacterium]|nr:hypothetical protein [Candidatus Omnitrophota bacterium]